MKKIYLIFILALACVAGTQIYSLASSDGASYLLPNNEEWDEILADIMTDTGSPRSMPIGEYKPVRIYQNCYFLKVNVFIAQNVTIKILDEGGSQVMTRQYIYNGDSNELLISTGGMAGGLYKMEFVDAAGRTFAKAQVIID